MKLSSLSASPKILEWNDKIIFGLKDPVNITCQAPANPPANITWEKIEGNGSIVVITRASYLRFDELTKEDAGQYRCTAENKFKAVSAYVELAVKGSTQGACHRYSYVVFYSRKKNKALKHFQD